jgi:chorismate mutase/prephenate dehydratase
VSNGETDPVIKQFREKISDNDLKLVDALNKRLKLVEQLRNYKLQQGVEFYDPGREEWMLTFVSRANKGPLSADGLHEIFEHILTLTKAELESKQQAPAAK